MCRNSRIRVFTHSLRIKYPRETWNFIATLRTNRAKRRDVSGARFENRNRRESNDQHGRRPAHRGENWRYVLATVKRDVTRDVIRVSIAKFDSRFVLRDIACKMGIFFAKKKQPSRVTEQDKAILVSLNLYLIVLLSKLSNHSLIVVRT